MPQPSAAVTGDLRELYRRAARATARGSRSFYFATRFFPAGLARSAHAVYWFCRTTDDLVDEAPSPAAAARDLAAWEQALRALLAGRAARHPVLELFGRALAEHSIPHEYPLELIEGMRMDLTIARYRDFSQLRLFCYRAASVVGLMMMRVIGYRGDPAPYAVDLGIGMQLTNILRDVGEDFRRGRIYLPLEELRGFGYGERELAAGLRNAAFRRLMEFQIARARSYYRSAAPGIALLDPRGRFAVEVAARVYAAILGEIEHCGYDVFHRRAAVPARRKYWIALRAMAWPALRNALGHAAGRVAGWKVRPRRSAAAP
jgi:phytoene synthase